MRYDPAIYDGAAVHYRYGRPAYSPELEALLAEELGLDGSGRLLDAGCGPGILTVRLAHLFEEAVGLDPDAEMIAEGRRAAEERGIANITWVQALAEDLPGAAPGTYRVVSFGQSFWWTDKAPRRRSGPGNDRKRPGFARRGGRGRVLAPDLADQARSWRVTW